MLPVCMSPVPAILYVRDIADEPVAAFGWKLRGGLSGRLPIREEGLSVRWNTTSIGTGKALKRCASNINVTHGNRFVASLQLHATIKLAKPVLAFLTWSVDNTEEASENGYKPPVMSFPQQRMTFTTRFSVYITERTLSETST
jgi:hypothetical protein